MHGHRYIVTLVVASKSKQDVVVDYHELHAGLREILNRWEHRCLNDILKRAPTCENLAREIMRRAKARWESVSRVEVQEQEGSGCVLRN